MVIDLKGIQVGGFIILEDFVPETVSGEKRRLVVFQSSVKQNKPKTG